MKTLPQNYTQKYMGKVKFNGVREQNMNFISVRFMEILKNQFACSYTVQCKAIKLLAKHGVNTALSLQKN